MIWAECIQGMPKGEEERQPRPASHSASLALGPAVQTKQGKQTEFVFVSHIGKEEQARVKHPPI